jgi:hypothetical protein
VPGILPVLTKYGPDLAKMLSNCGTPRSVFAVGMRPTIETSALE